MTLETLTVRGFMTAFAGKQVSINFTELPDGLIALVGGNGEGKTTLLEAAPAGVYRQMMSRDGDLKTYAQDRDSSIESVWAVGNNSYRAVLAVDGIKGGASAALEHQGHRSLNDGKVSTYDTAISKVFPPVHVFKASAFAAQNKSGSFVRASKKDRRDIFNAFLNLDRLVAMSETAKACAAEVEKARTSLRYEIQNLETATAGQTAPELVQQLHGLAQQGAEATRRRDELAAAIAATEQQLAALADHVTAHAAAKQRVNQLADLLSSRRRDLQHRTAADTQAAAAEALELQQIERAHADKLNALNDSDRKAATADAAELIALANELAEKLADIDRKLDGNRQIQSMADDIRKAVATIAEQTAEHARLRGELEQLRAEERDLAKQQAENEQRIHSFTKPQAELDRAKADAALLEHVPCGGADQFAGCQFLVNAKTAQKKIAQLEATVAGITAALATRERLAPAIVRVAAAIDAAKKAADAVELLIKQAQTTAAYADKLAASEARVEELQAQRATLQRDYLALGDQANARHSAGRLERARQRETLAADFAQAKGRLAARIDDRIEASRVDLDALAAAVQAADAELAAAVLEERRVADGNSAAAALQAQLAAQRADRDSALTAIATAASDAAVVRKRIEELQAQTARVTVLRGRLELLNTELLEWQLLQKALDRDGLPALETDQAGPEISALTNQILADCFDSRFSVELVTQVLRADGKGMKDEFTLLVTDNHTGQIRDIADLSGGEEVIVAEAFMNAISLYINARSASPMRTWFRDETTGALTKENTQRYVRMLRKVQAMGDVRQIVFISHDPDAFALADAQIHVAGGAVSTVLPPYSEAA